MGIIAWIRRLLGSRRRAKRKSSSRRYREELFPNLFVRQLEERRVLNGTPLTVFDEMDDGPDTFHIVCEGENLEVTVNGEEFYSGLLADVSDITVNGSGADDTLIVDFSGGNPFPLGGISFDGAGGTDLLVIEGAPPEGPIDTVTHGFYGIGAGFINVDVGGPGGGPEGPGGPEIPPLGISYEGVESITDATAADHLVFQFGSLPEMVTLSDDGDVGDGQSLISSLDATPVTFTSPGVSLFVMTDTGSELDYDVVNVAGLDSQFNADLMIQGGADDTIDFSGPLDLGDGHLTVQAGSITVNNTITTAGSVHVTSTDVGGIAFADGAGEIVTTGGSITLRAQGPGALVNIGNLTTGGGDVLLESATTTTVNGLINAGGGRITLTTDEIELTPTAGLQGTGPLVLQPLGAATSIGLAGGAGTFNLDAAELALIQDGFSGITIGRADGTHGIRVGAYSFADPITLRTPLGGWITIDGQLDTLAAGAGAAIVLDGSGATTFLNADVITAGGAIVFSDAVEVGDGLSVTVNSASGAPAGADITFQNTLNGNTAAFDGGETLILNAGTGGDVLFQGAVGGVSVLDVTITDSGSTTFTRSLNAGTVILTDTTGTVAFQGDTTISTGLTLPGTGQSGFSLAFTGTTNFVGGSLAFMNSAGAVTLGDEAGDSITFGDGLDVGRASGTSIAGTVATMGWGMRLGDVTMTADATLTSGSHAITARRITDEGGGFTLSL
ncbi:MAG: hypothetical protein HQ582_29835, partial [Planctomycetes bacterium]|nr:hypothetical protein [Planctomycetota bacterium]